MDATEVVSTACVFSGSFVLPPGAVLHGGTFDLGENDTITLMPSSGGDRRPTSLDGAHVVHGASTASVRVEGAGHAAITATTFDVTRGIAIGVSGASVTVDDVVVQGDVHRIDGLELPMPTPATYGVAAIHGATVTITQSQISAMAIAAVVCTDSTVTLVTTVLDSNRGLGVLAFGSTVHATDLEIRGTISALGLPGMGIALLAGSTLATGARLHLHDAPGYGVFANGGSVTLTDPMISHMGQAGIWAEDVTLLSVSGGTFDANAGVAVAAIGVTRVDVHGATVTGTTNAPLPTMGGMGSESMADALHLVQRAGSPSTITLADLTLTNNARIGAILDGGGDPLALTVATTTVDGSGSELGVVAQHVASLPVGWDGGITRHGSTAMLDASAAILVVSDGVGPLGILMPPTIMF